MTSPARSIGEIVEPLITSSGLELWDVEQVPGAVRVYVDRPGGVSLDILGELARAISSVLDRADDAVPRGHYQLEVSSPGVERTLRTPDQFRRFIGSRVALKLVGAVDGSRRLQGVLLAADDSSIRIELPGRRSQDLTYDQVRKARTVWAPGEKTAGSPPALKHQPSEVAAGSAGPGRAFEPRKGSTP